jgi:hypothetical protein
VVGVAGAFFSVARVGAVAEGVFEEGDCAHFGCVGVGVFVCLV